MARLVGAQIDHRPHLVKMHLILRKVQVFSQGFQRSLVNQSSNFLPRQTRREFTRLPSRGDGNVRRLGDSFDRTAPKLETN